MGFPIRKSTDQRVFAPPRSLSQRITSFIACACQGIHQLPLRHLIVLIANAHPRNPEGIVAWAKSCAGFDPMSLAQKDQLLEIGSRARLGKPIICRRLSVSCDKSRTFRLMKFEQIFSLRCQKQNKRQARRSPQTFFTNDLPDGVHLYSTPLLPKKKDGGAGRDRTDDILLAKQALSQLSYGP